MALPLQDLAIQQIRQHKVDTSTLPCHLQSLTSQLHPRDTTSIYFKFETDSSTGHLPTTTSTQFTVQHDHYGIFMKITTTSGLLLIMLDTAIMDGDETEVHNVEVLCPLSAFSISHFNATLRHLNITPCHTKTSTVILSTGLHLTSIKKNFKWQVTAEMFHIERKLHSIKHHGICSIPPLGFIECSEEDFNGESSPELYFKNFCNDPNPCC